MICNSRVKIAVLLGLASVGAGLYYVYVKRKNKRHRVQSAERGKIPPGLVPSHPDLGNLIEIGKAGSPQQFMERMQREFGAIASFYWRKELTVCISTPELLRTQERLFNRAQNMWCTYSDIIGHSSVQFANGPEGRMRRELYDRVLHSSEDLCLPVFVQESEKLAEHWLAKAAVGQPIALNEEINELAIRIAMRSLFGVSPSGDHVVQLLQNYTQFAAEVASCFEDPVSRPPDAYFSDRRKQAGANIRSYFARLVDEHRKKRENGETSEFLLLDKMCELVDKRIIDEETLLNDAITFWIGGFHTTAAFVVWSIYYLAKLPETQQKVFEEINAALEGGKICELTKSLVASLSYLKQFQNEVLRVALRYVSYASRDADVDMSIGDYVIPAKTPIWQNLSGPFRDARYFLKPDEFNPENFSVAASRSRPACSFEPFGIGKRRCPAYKLAYLECSCVLIVGLCKFRLRLLDTAEVKQKAGMVVYPEHEIFVTVENRL